jgi:hypothetical protein
MAKSVDFEDVNETNVDDLLESHSSELANEERLEMENNMNYESQEPFFPEPIKQLQAIQMAEFFKYIDSAIRITEENDPNETRSAKIARQI